LVPVNSSTKMTTCRQEINQLIFQDDGNLVLYMSPGPNQVVEWASNTYGQDAQYAIMQTDGNFVIYGSDQPPLGY
jgi:hypothetical protein